MKWVLSLELSEAAAGYFDASARIRDMPRNRLISELLTIIADDQLILGILDDDSKRRPRTGSQRGWYRKTENPAANLSRAAQKPGLPA